MIVLVSVPFLTVQGFQDPNNPFHYFLFRGVMEGTEIVEGKVGDTSIKRKPPIELNFVLLSPSFLWFQRYPWASVMWREKEPVQAGGIEIYLVNFVDGHSFCIKRVHLM